MVKAPARLGLLLALALATAACGAGGGNAVAVEGANSALSGELKIGVISPFSGPNAPGGEAIYQGYEIAAEQVNAGAGVMGKKVTLVRGDASVPEQGISEVNRLATSQNVDLFAGSYLSGISNTASQTALRYGKLFWDTNATAGNLTERGLNNYARPGPMATQFAQVAAEAVEKILPAAVAKPVDALRVCVTHEESIYGTTISERVVENLAKLGAEVSAQVAYSPTAPDLGNVVLRCQQSNPDVWIETGYVSDINLLLRTAEQQGFTPKARLLIGTGDTRLTLEAVTAKVLEGVFVVGYPHFDINENYAPGAAEFLTAFTKKNGAPPTFPQTLTAYAGMQMLFDALNEAQSVEPAKVMEVITGWDKPLGSYATGYGAKFNDSRQNIRALPTVLQWQSGKTVTVYPAQAKLPSSKILGSTA